MSEVLRRYIEFSVDDLAEQLHRLVKSNAVELEKRNFLGVVARYGTDLDQAKDRVASAVVSEVFRQPKHFAVVDRSGDIVGAASIYKGLKLRRLALPIPPKFGVGPLAQSLSVGPNLSAWVTGKDQEVLAGAYHEMLDDVTTEAPRRLGQPLPWTVEPLGSPNYVHSAIEQAGFTPINEGRFDDQESNLQIPPRAKLYVPRPYTLTA